METALISKIQHYSTKDGPGIRTTVFFMGCNLRCLWCANPENLQKRQRVFYFKERCHHCGLCVQSAHHHAIQFAKVGCDIDRKKCDNLLDMVDLCPYDAYEIIGYKIREDELVNKLKRDLTFYQVGEGGVTFSGGEAALQSQFIKNVSKELKKDHIHICLDTAGLIPSNELIDLVKNVDMILYDIKAMDDDIHQHCTGVSNALILKNAQILSQMHKDMIIRLVIVPQYNDDIEDMKKRVDFICSLGDCVKQVDILKYHIYGIGKYEKLGMDYPISQNQEVDDQKIQILYNYASAKGLKVTIGG